MSPVRETKCPSCGAPVEFKTSTSVVVVCEYCSSCVGRGDVKLEDLGKVAELADTGSPLRVGLAGSFEGVGFQLTGRAQMRHAAGGVWDEWYAFFQDGRWGWLAEAQGRFYMTFEKKVWGKVPGLDALSPGEPVPGFEGSTPFVVAEKGTAWTASGEGEIPWRLVPGEEVVFADLSGPGGAFATLDLSDDDAPRLYVGREVRFDELGFPAGQRAQERPRAQVEAAKLSCPQCGGPMALRAPDKTLRVTCPQCGSLLDVNQGRLELLKALEGPRLKPVVPLGASGELRGKKLTAIGFLKRSVEISGLKYYWEEYLLYDARWGFRWLVRSDDHWNLVEGVPVGDVRTAPRTVTYKGEAFKLFQRAPACVEFVWGEVYWKVEVGEKVKSEDYVAPPLMLSKEEGDGEVNWSLGTYLEPAEVERAFSVKLPSPRGIAPNQPFPHKAIYRPFWKLLAAAFAVLVLSLFFPKRLAYEKTLTLEPTPGAAESQAVFFSEPFDLASGKNVHVDMNVAVDNSWFYADGDLVDEATGLTQAFALPIEYYHGVDGGESWSEGSTSDDAWLSALPEGKYTLRLEAHWEKKAPIVVRVLVEQNATRAMNFILVLLAVSLPAIVVGIWHLSFESRRWQESEFGPQSGS